MSNFDEDVMNMVASVQDAQKVAELICEYNNLVTLVEDMRKAQKVYAEMFPTGYGCYAPVDLEKKVDKLIEHIRGKERS